MLAKEYINELTPDIDYEKASIDDILVYIAKEAAHEKRN